jgi:hypothetical protein
VPQAPQQVAGGYPPTFGRGKGQNAGGKGNPDPVSFPKGGKGNPEPAGNGGKGKGGKGNH